MQREFSAQRVLIAFIAVDLGNGKIQAEHKADQLRIALLDIFELSISPAAWPQHKSRIEVIAGNQSDS